MRDPVELKRRKTSSSSRASPVDWAHMKRPLLEGLLSDATKPSEGLVIFNLENDDFIMRRAA